MEIYNNKSIIHYPSLRTILMIEKVLREADIMIGREELKRKLPVKIMHQTLNLILKYLEEKEMIVDSHKGILWIYSPSSKSRKAVENAEKMNYKTNLKTRAHGVRIKKNIKEIAKIILSVIKRFNVVRAGIFGSYARGEENKKSDIDIVIEFRGKRSLLDLVGLQLAIEQALNKKADVITYKSINPLLKKKILNEEIRIL